MKATSLAWHLGFGYNVLSSWFFLLLTVLAFKSVLADRRVYIHHDCNTSHYGLDSVIHAFESHRIEWSVFGRDDPWWSVLTDHPKGTELSMDKKSRFYETGRSVVDEHMQKIAAKRQLHFQNALDFGCGLGRISLAVARLFEHVTCVDHSLYHLKKARDETHMQNATLAQKIRFVLSGPRLEEHLQKHSYDLVISFIALQHSVTELQVIYVEQMCDMLGKGGLGYIQIPTYLPQNRETHCGHLDRGYQKDFPFGMQMHYTPLDELQFHLRRRRCEMVSSDVCDMTGSGVSSCIFFEKRN